MMMKNIILFIALFLSLNAFSQNCEDATEFIDEFCFNNINQPTFGTAFTFISPETEVNFSEIVSVSNCANLTVIYILYDSNCIEIETNSGGDFINLIPNNQYIIEVNVTCSTGLVRNFCLDEEIILPIELYHFDGFQEESTVAIEWITLTEVNNDRFVIQHSTDNENWNDIKIVYSLGDSYVERYYHINHDNPKAGVNYYRLLSYDYNDIPETSKVIAIYFNARILDILKYNVLGQKIIE